MCRDPLLTACEAKVFFRCGLYRYAIDRHTHHRGQHLAHPVYIWAQFGTLHYDGDICIDYIVTPRSKQFDNTAQQPERIGPAKFFGGIGEMQTYVAQRGRPQECVTQRMYRYIAVGVGNAPAIVFDPDATHHQWKPCGKCVYIVSVPYA